MKSKGKNCDTVRDRDTIERNEIRLEMGAKIRKRSSSSRARLEVWNSGDRLNGSRSDVDGETEEQIRNARVERLRGGDLWGVHAR